MLRIENVNKNFGKKVILKDINLTVKPGRESILLVKMVVVNPLCLKLSQVF